ncbi:MAG: hypothetical protein H6738_12450 [Alphaproteobacteria bacterium]|nr:hypothetical protein [Alphaproteobacteria bacterium]
MLPLLACTAAPPPEPATTTPAPPSATLPAPPTGPRPFPADTFTLEVAPGLTVAAVRLPDPPDDDYHRVDPAELVGCDPRVFVVTVDPRRHEIAYLSTLDPAVGHGELDASAWASRHDLLVAFNPGMFEPDGSATGHTRAGSFASQPQVRRHRMYASWLTVTGDALTVLNQAPPPSEATYVPYDALPAALRGRLDAADLVVQSLSVIADGRAVYPARTNQWSELAFGADRDGNLVVVFSRYPWEMRELGRRLVASGLPIADLLHGEGGPEASLVVRAGGYELIAMGSWETGFAGDENRELWQVPAVMGVRPRAVTEAVP